LRVSVFKTINICMTMYKCQASFKFLTAMFETLLFSMITKDFYCVTYLIFFSFWMARVQVLETASCVKKRVRLVQYTKWWDPFPDPAYAGALCTGLPFLMANVSMLIVMLVFSPLSGVVPSTFNSVILLISCHLII
jgi:hypothetical protein